MLTCAAAALMDSLSVCRGGVCGAVAASARLMCGGVVALVVLVALVALVLLSVLVVDGGVGAGGNYGGIFGVRETEGFDDHGTRL